MFIQRAGHGNVACSQTNIQYLRGSGRDKHNVKAVRKQLMEQTESLPALSSVALEEGEPLLEYLYRQVVPRAVHFGLTLVVVR